MEQHKATVMKPCVKCGASDRVPSGKCRPCALAYAAEYRAKNHELLSANALAYREKTREEARQRSAEWRAKKGDALKPMYAERYKKNAEKVKQKAREAYAADPELARVKKAEWRAANPERQLEIHRRYRQNNLEVCRQRENAKRAMRLAAPGRLSVGIRKKLFTLQKGRCACCGDELGDDYHLDHIHPLASGGSNTDDNVQLLRRRCNQAKGKKHPVEFMQSKGYLL